MTNLALWMYTTRSLQTGPAALLATSNLDHVASVSSRKFLPLSVWLESLVDLAIRPRDRRPCSRCCTVFAPTRFAALAPIVFVIHSMPPSA